MHNTFEDLRKTRGKGEVLEILKCGKWGSLKEEKEGFGMKEKIGDF